MKKDLMRVQAYLEKFGLTELFHKETLLETGLVNIKAGEFLVGNGEPIHMLYILVSGKLKITTTLPNGRSMLLRFCQPISLLGDIELVNSEHAGVQVETTSDAELITIPHRCLREHEMDNPVFLRYLLDQVCHKLNTVSLAASVNVLTSVENRFASYLVSVWQNQEHLHFKRGELETTKLTEIAELLGTSYRHLNRVIKKFVDLQIISKEKDGIVILDMEHLMKLSNGSIYQ